jgi:hypothetical protein
MQQVDEKDEMAGRGDRQEFGKAFDQPEEGRLAKADEIHELRFAAIARGSHP